MSENEIARVIVDVALADKRLGWLMNVGEVLLKEGVARVWPEC